MSNADRYERFQKALSEARLEKGLTQSDIAARLGRHQSFVSKYESGERRLDVIEFLEVCDAISVSHQSILRKVLLQNA
jgi:transcriptional regulator with XRE-family HTH domain